MPINDLPFTEKVNPGLVDSDNLLDEISERRQTSEDAESLQWLQRRAEVPDEAITFEFPSASAAAKGAGRVLADVARGATEIPRQVIGGARDAVQEMLDATDSLGDFLTENVADLGAIQITDEQGNLDLELKGPGEVSPDETGVSLPEVKQAESVTGNLVRKTAQFLTGFAVAGQALPAQAASRLGAFGTAAARGAIADATVFDPHEERLSDLIQEFPALQNPVTEFLAASDTDSEAVGRMKNALEGLGLGTLTEGFIRSMRVLRAARKAKAATPRAAAQALGEEGQQILREAGSLDDLLGDANTKLVTRQTGLQAGQKAKAAAKETELPVPTDVAARGVANAGRLRVGDGEMFINWRRIESPDDIKAVIGDVADAFKPDIDKARRGVQPNAVTRKMADKQDAWQIVMARRKGDPLNAEQSIAARELWAAAGDRLATIAETASTTPTPENLFQFRRMLAVFHAIQKEVIGARTETARALQSWAMPTGGRATQFRGLIDQLELGGGVDVSRTLAEKFAKAAQTQQPLGIMSALAEKSVYEKTRDAVLEYWVNALLSGPKTHAVNAISNTSVIGLSVMERAVAARISALSGEAGVELGESLAQMHGLRHGLKDAFRNAGKAFVTGQTGFGLNKIELPRTRDISSTAMNLRSDSVAGRVVDAIGSAVNIPGRALQSADEFFKTHGYRMEVHAQAHRMAMGELQAGKITQAQVKERLADIVANPPESIHLEAAYTAAYQTFTNEGGDVVKGINRLRSRVPALRLVAPFVNTPGNIFKYTFERTPLAPLSSKYRAAIAKGGADAAMARARMSIGTALIALSYDLAMDGHLTGGGPESGPDRANFFRRGERPYSWRFKETSIAYNRLDPIGFLLGIGADMAEFTTNADHEDMTSAEFEEAVLGSIMAVAENVTSKSYMQGMAMLVEAIQEPKRFGPRYLERLASSFVPAGAAEAARATDPYMRASHDIWSSLKRRTPGFSSDLPKRRDLWGREVTYQSGLGTAYDVMSPLYGSKRDPQPIDEEMKESGYAIGNPQRGMTMQGEYVSFKNRPEIYTRYLQLQGGTKPADMGAEGLEDTYGNATLLETLNAVVTGKSEFSPDYDELTDPQEKRHFISGIVRDYREAARDRLLLEFPEIQEIAARKKASRERAIIRKRLEELE